MSSEPVRPLVLLAEDDDEMRALIASRLTDAGMHVIDVEDGLELADYLARCHPSGPLPRPDVVVTDVRMPGESGLEALLHSHFHRAPVVVISSFVNAEVRAYAARVGVVAIFQKPFALRELVTAIRRVVIG